MDQLFLIRWAREVLRQVTPFRFDCGTLCSGACCQGKETDGMWIFPGEEVLLEKEKDFTVYREEPAAVVCSGSCDRDVRPLSCRIFPLYPLVTEREDKTGVRIRLFFDPRATRLCPIAGSQDQIDPDFLRAVRKAVRILALDEELKKYLISTGEYLEELAKFQQRLG